ncbi:MAG: hypothetical protein EPN60_16955 [Nevskiaceae bacterium]|nr:MAG: hypothetical protein EPN60_16955 [Nevskiaceae bacterium]
MARIRTIKPEFVQSESIGRVSRDARLLFIQLWTVCDDEGRLRGTSRSLARTLYPHDDGEDGHFNTTGPEVEAWMGELEREGCVQRYAVDGDSYVALCNWLKHQKIDKATRSKLPPPPPQDQGHSRELAKPRDDSPLDLGPRTKDQEEEKATASAPSPAAAGSPPPSPVEHFPAIPLPTAVITIPTNTGEEFPIYPPMVDEFSSAYPAVDVLSQLRAMRAWSVSNPTHRKTKSGMPRFINGWLSKEQNRPPTARPSPPKAPPPKAFDQQDYLTGFRGERLAAGGAK